MANGARPDGNSSETGGLQVTCRRKSLVNRGLRKAAGRHVGGAALRHPSDPDETGRQTLCRQGVGAAIATSGTTSAARGGSTRSLRRREAYAVLTAAQQELVVRNMGLVGLHLRKRVHLPRRPSRRREAADLFQTGCLALVRAAGRYDASRDGDFAPFALQRIRGAVFTALHEHFATIRIPTKVMVQARREQAAQDRPPQLRLPVAHQLSDPAARILLAPPCSESGFAVEPTIRQCIRLRFERAVTAAVDELRSRRWRRPDANEIIAAVASGRLLSARCGQQATIREMAARLNISCGRISEYEKMLQQAVQQRLACDPQLPRLLAFAREDRHGMDGRLTPEQRETLIRDEQHALTSRLASMAHEQQAELLYRLVRESGAAPDEVILNLHRLSVCREIPPASAPE